MTESPLREVIVLRFDDQLGVERLPFSRALGAPATRSTGRAAGEAPAVGDGLAQHLDLGRQLIALFRSE